MLATTTTVRLPPSSLPPRDRYHFVYIVAFFQGVGVHFPWSALITALKYYEGRLAGSSYARDFMTYFAIIFMTVKFLFLLAAIGVNQKLNDTSTMSWSTLGNTSVFLCLLIMSRIPSLDTNTFYYITLVLVSLAALFVAFSESAFFSLLGALPTHITQAYISGQGVAAVLVCFNLFVTYFYFSGQDADMAVVVYFALSVVAIFASWVLFMVVQMSNYYRHYRDLAELKEITLEELDEKSSSTIKVVQHVWKLAVSILVLCAETLLIYPTFVSLTRSVWHDDKSAGAWAKALFVPVGFLVYNMGDLVGKMLPGLPMLAIRRMPFLLVSAVRGLLLPLLLFGNVYLDDQHVLDFPKWFANDFAFMVIVFVIGLTGGYLGTLMMMWAPDYVGVRDRGRAAVIMVFFSMSGLVGGSILALLLKHYLIAFHSMPIAIQEAPGPPEAFPTT